MPLLGKSPDVDISAFTTFKAEQADIALSRLFDLLRKGDEPNFLAIMQSFV
jgi:hypothetical protein